MSAQRRSHKGPAPTDPVTRFWRRVKKSDGCWEWQGCRANGGYGRFGVLAERIVYAHRFSYELHYGALPPGAMVCHHCDNPPCVRPDHLFAGDDSANVRDMVSKGRLRSFNGSKTQCVNGHPFDSENTLRRADGFRGCRTCRKLACRARRARRRAGAGA